MMAEISLLMSFCDFCAWNLTHQGEGGRHGHHNRQRASRQTTGEHRIGLSVLFVLLWVGRGLPGRLHVEDPALQHLMALHAVHHHHQLLNLARRQPL